MHLITHLCLRSHSIIALTRQMLQSRKEFNALNLICSDVMIASEQAVRWYVIRQTARRHLAQWPIRHFNKQSLIGSFKVKVTSVLTLPVYSLLFHAFEPFCVRYEPYPDRLAHTHASREAYFWENGPTDRKSVLRPVWCADGKLTQGWSDFELKDGKLT
ncbi:hypothetical protein Krac_7943 [Ktedonobacter racemifer DSM 44963]|uniref:Uncharacterized protein n=1 Tax=Ktedonobacter racemifer DSM 44963 TaxID=485913 RepID=D6TLI5_KTERA|nr:hypothetical protein Krac_7943 [Ktedonobacter racemifer DSM 44963]